ncbi:MAG TPA: hypothetical protein VL475_03250, partial [Planctomycetaceae bacterium]|nr:hypothetical protein [Planctomycetaceae bacterium]
AEFNRCIDCHELSEQLARSRPAFWHFENVHRVVLDRGTDCRNCHAELAPYREDNHRISPQVLTASCVHCHTARE